MENPEKFYADCVKVFMCLRQHVNTFANLLLLLVDIPDNGISKEKLESEIRGLLLPAEAESWGVLIFVQIASCLAITIMRPAKR